MQSSLFSYAIENEKTLYIDVLRFPPPDFKKSTVDVFKLTGRRPAMNQTHRASMLQQKKTFECFCRAQPCVALEMPILIVWRKIGKRCVLNVWPAG